MYELVFEDGERARLYPGEFTCGRKQGECAIVLGHGEDKTIRWGVALALARSAIHAARDTCRH
jgi:hypothetical protein